MNLFEYAGRFHPLIVHLPIGILIVFLVLAFAIPRKRLLESYQIVRILLIVSALSATFSCFSGLMLASSGNYDAQLTANHRNMAIALAILNWFVFFGFKKLLNLQSWIFYITLFLIYRGANPRAR